MAIAAPGSQNFAQMYMASLQRGSLQMTQGISDAKINSHETTALANYLERSRLLAAQLGQGGIDDNERQQLLDRVQGYQDLADKYKSGEYFPTPEKDDPFKNPKEALHGLQLDTAIGGFKDLDEGWNPFNRRLYRFATDWQGAPEGYKLPPVPEQKPGGPIKAYPDLAAAGQRNFTAWDTDKNGNLSAAEMNSAMADKGNTGVNAVALATLRRNYQDGLSLKDLETFQNGSATPELAQLFSDTNRNFANMAHRGPGADKLGEIDPTTVQQGFAGSCMLLAGLNGMKPEDISKMIKPNDDGTYTVKFANGKQTTVPAPTEAERLYGAHGGDGGYWPTVLESALGKVIGERDGRDPRQSMDGITPTDLMSHLTGQEVTGISFDKSSHNDAREALGKLEFGPGHPIVASTRDMTETGMLKPEFSAVERLENGLNNNHAYAVLGFDRESNLVTLRNPHGEGELNGADKINDGTFQIPFDRFYASFHGVVHPQ